MVTSVKHSGNSLYLQAITFRQHKYQTFTPLTPSLSWQYGSIHYVSTIVNLNKFHVKNNEYTNELCIDFLDICLVHDFIAFVLQVLQRTYTKIINIKPDRIRCIPVQHRTSRLCLTKACQNIKSKKFVDNQFMGIF